LLTLPYCIWYNDEAVVTEATYNTQFGVLARRQVCNMIRYADNKAVVCQTLRKAYSSSWMI